MSLATRASDSGRLKASGGIRRVVLCCVPKTGGGGGGLKMATEGMEVRHTVSSITTVPTKCYF